MDAELVRQLLLQRKIATMPELKAVLGTEVDLTVFRTLRALAYHSSYSHRGKYYTLHEIARFDELGLWSFRSVFFSQCGTLRRTCETLVGKADAGYATDELEHVLHVGVKDPLRELARQGRIGRDKVAGRFVYFSADAAVRKAQWRARQIWEAHPRDRSFGAGLRVVPDELKAANRAVFLLARRAPAAVVCGPGVDEARPRRRPPDRRATGARPGHGGQGQKAAARPRRGARTGPNQGRRAQTRGKKTPEVIARIEALMQHDVAGDPCTGVKWTRRTTRKIAAELNALGIAVGAQTVARLLKDLTYCLRVNHKRVSRGSGPDRNEQFEYISAQRTRFAQQGLPIVSIDTKKKEMVGNFKNPGTAWQRTPALVNDHDFRSHAEGMATPYGVYDVRANRGTVFVGTSYDTPDLAVDNLVRWWDVEGRARYPGAAELLVLADSGGSNGPRSRVFKVGLQTRLCDAHGIRVTLCHYPAGASKWNPIEHRLFSEISKNWAGCPLRSYETILNYIRTTRTQTGLQVSAYLVDQEYPKGLKVPDSSMATLALVPHKIQPLRNYTIHPRP